MLNKLEDLELRDLSSRLPSIILHSRADSTVNKYLGAFKRWKVWAVAHKLSPPLPAKPYEFTLYLQHLSKKAKSKATVEEASISYCGLNAFQCRLDDTLLTDIGKSYIGRSAAYTGKANSEERANHS